MMINKKVKIAIAQGAVCGGCSVALFDLGEKLALLKNLAEIVFWPMAADFKFKDLENLEIMGIPESVDKDQKRLSEFVRDDE